MRRRLEIGGVLCVDSPGQAFGKYKLVQKIATGGMAEVFLAQLDGPAGFQKSLVVKRILPHLVEDEGFVEMFLNEARLAALLNHPNIVTLFDLGEDEGSYFIAMEYIDGPNLRSLGRAATRALDRIPIDCAAKIVSLACEGLGFAHDFAREGQPLGLIHRDISPDNIMMSRTGAVKVVDFGIAKAANQAHLTRTGTLKGKVSYMPPEQLQGLPLDRRADIFALGVVLYELLAGTRPFDSTSEIATMQSILYNPPTPLVERRSDCPESLWRIVERALEKDRERRYPDCRAMQHDLEAHLLEQRSVVGAWQLAQLVEKLMPAAAAGVAAGQPTGDGAISPGTNKRRAPDRSQEEVRTVMGAPTVFEAGSTQTPGPVSPARGRRAPLLAGVAAAAVVAALLGFLAWDRLGASPPAGSAPLAQPQAQPSGVSERPEPAADPRPIAALSESGADAGAEPADQLAAGPGAGVDPAAGPGSEPVAVAEPTNQPDAGEVALPESGSRQASAAAKRVAAARAKAAAAAAAAARRAADKPPAATAAQLDDSELPAAAGRASLSIETRPVCLVQVDGGPARRSPARFEQLAPGEHVVKISSSEHRIARSQRIQLAAGENRSEEVVVGSGKLSFWVRPWANVEVDGKAYGATPLPDKITLYEGEHRVRLVNPELQKTHVQTVTVRPGSDEVIRVNLER